MSIWCARNTSYHNNEVWSTLSNEGNTGQYFNWITSGPQTKTIKQKLSNQKYISLKIKNCKYIYEKDYKEWKLYYNYKISLQWISTNYNYNKNTTRIGQARGRLWNAGLASDIFWHPVMHVQFLFIFTTKRREWVCSSNYMEPECLMPSKYHTKFNIITKEWYTNIPK